jgi:hyaluronoglucosaminidase
MSVALRGVIEGFYGRLWEPAERQRVRATIADAGMNVYAYAPKEDRLQNVEWRRPYPKARRDELERLALAGDADGCALWIGLRPLGISYADEADARRVAEKLASYLEMGAERVVLLADDISSELDAMKAGPFTALAAAHAWLVTFALAALDLPPERLVFVPTDYHGLGSPYLETLGEELPPGVEVMWTGTDVFVRTMTTEEADTVARVIRREPLVWDNYPVNDDAQGRDLRIGPIRGRDPDLDRHVRGILANPALESEATLVPLLTWAEYLADPAAYDPDTAWSRALLQVAGSEGDAEVVRVIGSALDRSCLDQGWARPTPRELAAAVRDLDRLANRRLADDLRPFLP